MASNFLTAEWKNLIMANYVVDPEILKPHVPFGTELDLWEGKAYISIVGFMFLRTKVLGIPVPFHRNFEEVNLRFYVRHRHENEWRRGVVFIKELVPKWAISFVANKVYGEPYETYPMRNSLSTENGQLAVSYGWKVNDKWSSISVNAKTEGSPIEEGSEAEFITEHYWGYTQLGKQKTSQYEVGHPVWDIHEVVNYEIDADFEAVYGKTFAEALTGEPNSIFMAAGSDIFVKKGALIKG